MSEGNDILSKDFSTLSEVEQAKWAHQAAESYDGVEQSNATPEGPFSLEALHALLNDKSVPAEEQKEYEEMKDVLQRWEHAQRVSSQRVSEFGASKRMLPLNGPVQMLDHALDGSVMLEIEVANPRNDGAWTPINLINRYGSIVLHWNARPHDNKLVLNSYYKKWYAERWDYWNDKLGDKGGYIFLARKKDDPRSFYFATQKYGGTRFIWKPYTTPDGVWTPADRINYECRITARAAFGPEIWWKTYSQ